MKKKTIAKLTVSLVLILALALVSAVYSHCQIPCGIYGDQARFDMMAENITTVEKSIKMITELSKEEKPDMNQIVRWVQNKEKHSGDTAHIITYYFMAQRIKPVDKSQAQAYDKYIKKLILLHKMLIYSMKAKQSTDLSNVQMLRTSLEEFRVAYLEHGAHK